jgi:type II secretory pathway pseudopilin PulG
MRTIMVSIRHYRNNFFLPGTHGQRQTARIKVHFEGFSLLENLLSLTLSLFILVSALEVITQVKKVYNRLQTQQEASLAASIALEKIREDLDKAGTGVNGCRPPVDRWPIKVENSKITLFSGELEIKLAGDVEAGQNWALIVPLAGSDSKLRSGRVILITSQGQTDLVEIANVSNNRVTLSPPFSSSFRRAESIAYLLEEVEIYLDSKQSILRRKVNKTSGQPLLEEVYDFQPTYDPETNLTWIKLQTDSKKEKTHELFFYPKNAFKKS